MRLGTLLAERLLYAPSVGYCMLLSLSLYLLSQGICTAVAKLHEMYLVKSTSGVKNKDGKDGKKEKKNRNHSKKSISVKNGAKEGADGDTSPIITSNTNTSPNTNGNSHTNGHSSTNGSSSEKDKEKEREVDKEKDKEKEREKEKSKDLKTLSALKVQSTCNEEWVVKASKGLYWILIVAITVTYIRLTVSTVDILFDDFFQ